MDSPADNLAFKDKFNFPYDLLSDTDKSMSMAYGAAEADSPRPARISVLVLREMGADPLLDLKLRLGEGSGAALAWPLLMSACAIMREMASFETAGVSRDYD